MPRPLQADYPHDIAKGNGPSRSSPDSHSRSLPCLLPLIPFLTCTGLGCRPRQGRSEARGDGIVRSRARRTGAEWRVKRRCLPLGLSRSPQLRLPLPRLSCSSFLRHPVSLELPPIRSSFLLQFFLLCLFLLPEHLLVVLVVFKIPAYPPVNLRPLVLILDLLPAQWQVADSSTSSLVASCAESVHPGEVLLGSVLALLGK